MYRYESSNTALENPIATFDVILVIVSWYLTRRNDMDWNIVLPRTIFSLKILQNILVQVVSCSTMLQPATPLRDLGGQYSDTNEY